MFVSMRIEAHSESLHLIMYVILMGYAGYGGCLSRTKYIVKRGTVQTDDARMPNVSGICRTIEDVSEVIVLQFC